MYDIHQVIVVSVLFDIAIVVKRPASRPYLHEFKPVARVSEAPVLASASRYAKVVLAAKAGVEFLRWNALAFCGRLLPRITRSRRLSLLLLTTVLVGLGLFFLLLLFLFLLLFLLLFGVRLLLGRTSGFLFGRFVRF